MPKAPSPRKVGPGRLERGYQARVRALEEGLAASRMRQQDLAQTLSHARGELVVAERLERGLQRLADRQEERILDLGQRESRLVLALGALQRENELLRAELGSGSAARPPELGGPAVEHPAPSGRTRKPRGRASRGLWARLFSRSRPSA